MEASFLSILLDADVKEEKKNILKSEFLIDIK